MGQGISAGYEVSGMSERSASSIGGKNYVFRASAFTDVIAYPEGVTWLRIDGMMGGSQLHVYAHFASSHEPFLSLQLWPQPA
jgi:hypothetical protein